MADTFVSVIIAAAGMSRRMGTTSSKQLLDINGLKVIEHSLTAFSKCNEVKEIIIVTKKEDLPETEKLIQSYPKVKEVVEGGKERLDSVKNGFGAISENAEYVAVHDAARPLVTPTLIKELIKEAKCHGAVCPVSRINDTVKEADEKGCVVATRGRDSLFLAQTPQIFKTDIYRKALEKIAGSSVLFTDDASILENAGISVKLYVNPEPNLKITRAQDVSLAQYHLSKKGDTMRIGHGYDVHRLVENRDLILGGVKVPHTHGLLGHSDADVLTHAVMDAIIGALGLGDIGRHFPDTDEKYRGISSMVLLEHTKKLLDENNYTVANVDATLIAQKPKLSPYIPQMIENIANTLVLDPTLVNVKATTEEGLGFTGDLSGISAHAVVIIKK